MGIKIQNSSENIHAIRFSNRGRRTYWKQYGEKFTQYLSVYFIMSAVRNRTAATAVATNYKIL